VTFGGVQHTLPARLAVAYYRTEASRHAAQLALHACLTAVPMLLGLVALMTVLVNDRRLNDQVLSALVDIFPSATHAEFQDALHRVQKDASLLVVGGFIGLVWGGTGLFAALEYSLDKIWGIPSRSLVRQRVAGLRVSVAFTFAVAATVLANALLADLPGSAVLRFVGGALITTWLVVGIYIRVPNRRSTLAEIWPGALLGGVSIQVLTIVFPIFFSSTGGISELGRGLAFLWLLIIWIYLVCQLVLLGAVLNKVLADGRPASGRDAVSAAAGRSDPAPQPPSAGSPRRPAGASRR
jgi:membrane protein